MKTLSKLQVLADPQHKGKHPYHDNRYIVTAGAHFEELRYPWDWNVEDGSIIAQMKDCPDQKDYARLFAAAPELLAACEAFALRKTLGDELDARKLATAAIAKAKGGE